MCIRDSYSTNVAMAGAREFKKAPKMIAEAIEKYLELGGTVFEKVEIAGRSRVHKNNPRNIAMLFFTPFADVYKRQPLGRVHLP